MENFTWKLKEWEFIYINITFTIFYSKVINILAIPVPAHELLKKEQKKNTVAILLVLT